MKALFAIFAFIAGGMFVFTTPVWPQADVYPWLAEYDSSDAITNRIPAPDGYERAATTQGTFEHWLSHLSLKEGKPPVYLYNGEMKFNQSAHVAVVDIDVGNRDLQQCADAIMRLRAEYLRSIGNYEAIHFNFTSGHRADFTRWIAGFRPLVNGNNVKWIKSQEEDASYGSFRAYLTKVFIYAGSQSLSGELHSVEDMNEMRIGDLFIQGGFPGHAVLVVDMAMNGRTGKKLFLLAQSYMPAQDIHVLKNPGNNASDPWYKLDFGETLRTPEWTFSRDDLKRF
ncbi:MAG: DUF4846 domain-containing protein [Candidatus Abyssubacteria bacterium]|nr:DUF4846 domain-containing protein [Candidatus Abyssubacteria bacterium]